VASGNGNLTPDEFVGDAAAKQRGEPFHTAISVVIPAYNEESAVGAQIVNIREVLRRQGIEHEIIVVDDGSVDTTAKVVEKLTNEYQNIILKKHDINRGYGQALKTGFDTAGKEYIFLMDSDGQFDISDLDKFLPYIDDSNIVIGYRLNRADSKLRKLNELLYHLYLRAIFGIKIKDVDCAFKIFPRDAYLKIRPIQSEGAFFSAELLMKFEREGYIIKEIPVNHYPRKYGKQSGANIKVILKMFVESFRILLK